jgi:tRNA dimethylallyltransferase
MATHAVKELPLIVIVGPTASGKTGLAIKLAKRFGGEIICADSRTIFKGMDIGTAKPSHEEQAAAPHWGIDLVEPGERFTAYDFKQYAIQKIKEIRSRGKIPFLVGGTGLYVDGLIFDYQFGGEVDFTFRSVLEGMSIQELQNYCLKNNVMLPENQFNKRYVIRAIEQKSISEKRLSAPIDNVIIVGISTDREILRKRIALRSEQLFNNNVVNEAIQLGKRYGWESEAMTGNVYPLIHKYSMGVATLDDIKRMNETLDWKLAKRQMTWLKRNKFIHWCVLNEADRYIARHLAKV